MLLDVTPCRANVSNDEPEPLSPSFPPCLVTPVPETGEEPPPEKEEEEDETPEKETEIEEETSFPGRSRPSWRCCDAPTALLSRRRDSWLRPMCAQMSEWSDRWMLRACLTT